VGLTLHKGVFPGFESLTYQHPGSNNGLSAQAAHLLSRPRQAGDHHINTQQVEDWDDLPPGWLISTFSIHPPPLA